MTHPQRISFGLVALALLAVGVLHMSMLLLTVLFVSFALQGLTLAKSRIIALVLFFLLLTGAGYGFYRFTLQALVTFPEIAERTIPAVVGFAEKYEIPLPFTDPEGFKSLALAEVKSRIAQLPHYATAAVLQLVYFIIGVVVAVGIFLNVGFRLDQDPSVHRDSIYARSAVELAKRMETFYRSFSRVMGAQILISAVNAILTGIFLFSMDFPYALVLTAFAFICGLLPIIGNIISNTFIVGVGFTISPQMALAALVFLITIHKLEYFLNSKIIGDRIKNPMWLTLIGLLLGEKLMGIPGMILAPVVLHYIKVEASHHRTPPPSSA